MSDEAVSDEGTSFPLQEYLGMELSDVELGAATATLLSTINTPTRTVLFTAPCSSRWSTQRWGSHNERDRHNFYCASVELSLRFIRPASEGKLIAEATVVKRGRSIVHLEARVHDGDDGSSPPVRAPLRSLAADGVAGAQQGGFIGDSSASRLALRQAAVMSDEASSEINTESDAPSADALDDVIESEAAERLAMRFGFDEEQTQLFLLLTDAASLFAQNGKPAFGDDAEQKQSLALFTRALNDPEIALAAWDAWSEEGLTGDVLQPFVDEIVGSLEGSQPGVIWLMSRQAALQLDNDESTRLLELVRDSGHASVLIDLAALQADGSNPIEARDLLRAAGVDTEIDLDAAYDPITSDLGLGVELAEEIAPFAAQRPKPIAGRNDVCPCGSRQEIQTLPPR